MTESLCDVCLRKVSASVVAHGGEVWLKKRCPEHGEREALLWSDVDSYLSWEWRSVHAGQTLDGTGDACNCPYTCGLCSGHEGDTCTAIFHITDRCNLHCPVCFADAGAERALEHDDLTLVQIEDMFNTVMAKTFPPTVQLSGGEPTLRDDLSDIIRIGKRRGVPHIQVNTNGLRLASDPGYAAELAKAGCDLVYLQFDGVDDGPYRALRGRGLFDVKRRAIENCRAAGLGVLLVVTVCEGVNTQQLGSIVQFAVQNMPIVRGIHFQPMTASGRAGCQRTVTFPDLFRLLEEQTDGQVARRFVEPRQKYDAHCSFSSVFFVGADGRLAPLTGLAMDPEQAKRGNKLESGAPARRTDVDEFVVEAVEYAARYWRATRRGCCGSLTEDAAGVADVSQIADDPLAAALHDRVLSISGMHFQDVSNILLDRTRGCCVHVVVPGCKSIPFCTYYLTSENGERLYNADGSCRVIGCEVRP